MPIYQKDIESIGAELSKKLTTALTARATRSLFFSTLSRLLQQYFYFDRLCINLYDQQGGMLTYFTAAEGTIISTLSPVRPAETSSTVAGHVITTRKPVIITDFAQYFTESTVHPIAEAGLTATMAFPLILGNDIIATLHCSFAKQPDDMYAISSLLTQLCPVIAICLGAVLSLEKTHEDLQRHYAIPVMAPAADERVICHSKVMRKVMRQLDAVAKLPVPILLLGETGTGKSLIAQDIHRRSLRKEAQFVRVNCPSLAQTLFESELFGHAKGAFTGASTKRIGRFELANGGTLFLDEIAELSADMQSKLLQVLEDSSFERVGESVPLAVDVRVIAATNVHIGRSIAQGKLRADLFYRLSPCTIEIPPLRERFEDLPPLIAALSSQLASTLGLPQVKFTPAMLKPMREYEWPGNVRELRNIVGRLVIHQNTYRTLDASVVETMLADSRQLLQQKQQPYAEGRATAQSEPAEDYAPPAGRQAEVLPGQYEAGRFENAPPAPKEKLPSLGEMERQHIESALSKTGGRVSGPHGAAAILGIPRSTLLHRMRKLGLLVKNKHGA
ncbi:sigma-54-dependent Fis family transcriptional regulator [Desulfovibrio sp. OttesenSCG-928-G15]|nr:sigma-54-dependent Fis family transcriptional regulator [Desulfovibrio sp. OttesenSCG-928-G15]